MSERGPLGDPATVSASAGWLIEIAAVAGAALPVDDAGVDDPAASDVVARERLISGGGIGSLRELVEMADMPSHPTLLKFMRERPDFPILQRGRKGLGYLIDLDAAASFVRAHWRDSRRRLADPQLPLNFGDDA